MPRPIIIDTDPGCDDAIAILLALASPELKVMGLTTVMGNTRIAQITENALKILALAGRQEIGVYQGCAEPFLVSLDTAEIVHGADGMAELDLPMPAVAASDMHAVDWMVETVMREPPGSITLCALGPLTNIALAIIKNREVAARLGLIAIMGGSFFVGGNSHRFLTAESNMANDPHAARVVFESGAKLAVFPLDLSHRILATPQRIEAVRRVGRPIAGTVARIMEFYSRFDVEKMGLPGGPIPDPAVIAWLISPELFRMRRVSVAVETESPAAMGMTIADWWGVTDRRRNADVAEDLNSDGFYNLLTDRLAGL